MMLFVKFMVEMDKKLIDEDEKYNLSKLQKELLKVELDKYYEKFNITKKDENTSITFGRPTQFGTFLV